MSESLQKAVSDALRVCFFFFFAVFRLHVETIFSIQHYSWLEG